MKPPSPHFIFFKHLLDVPLTNPPTAVLCADRLRPQDTDRRARLWKHLQSLLETYCHLQQNDQSFLVEVKSKPLQCTQGLSSSASNVTKTDNNIPPRFSRLIHARKLLMKLRKSSVEKVNPAYFGALMY